MKRRVRGKAKRRPAANLAALSTTRLGVTVAFVLIASVIWALRQSALTGAPFFPQLFITLVPFGLIIGVLMMMSRLTFGVLLLASIGFLLRDSIGRGLTFAGAVYWFIGAATAFFVSLSLYANYVAPPLNADVSSSSFMNFRLLLGQIFRDLIPSKPFNILPRDLPSSFETIGAGRLDSHQAITIHKGTRYVGTQGPGYIMLPQQHVVTDLIDLRPRMTSEKVFANTRDMFSVAAEITVAYSVRRPERETDNRAPFTYLKDAVRNLHYANVTYQSQHQVTAFQRVGGQAALLASEQISKRTLDEIVAVEAQEIRPIARIAQEVEDKLALDFKPKGIHIQSVSINHVQLPEEVENTRLRQWQGNWDASMMSARLGGGISMLDPESAEIRGKVVQELLDNVRTLTDAAGLSHNHAVRQRLENIIQDIATEGLIRSLVPPSKDD